MGQNYKLCFTFIFPNKKAPSADILQPVPYFVHGCVPRDLEIFLIELDMCKTEDSGYVYSWCKFCIELYACSKLYLSVVSAN